MNIELIFSLVTKKMKDFPGYLTEYNLSKNFN